MRIEIVKDEISPTLAVRSERLADWTKFNERLLRDGLQGAQSAIASEGLEGQHWPPMAESTIKKGRNPATLLIDHGILFGGLLPAPSDITRLEAGPSEGIAAVNYPGRGGYNIAAIQQKGAERVNIPPRPFLGWDENRIPVYSEWAAQHVQERP